MVKPEQEQADVGMSSGIKAFSPIEIEIYNQFRDKGFAVAHIDEHRNLWVWSQANNCGIYIGRRSTPTDSSKGNADNKWANPYKLDSRYPGDGRRDKVILSFYQHISNKASLHGKFKKELKGKILFCHCRKNVRNNKSNRCHGDILAALANNQIPFIDTNLSTGGVEFSKLYEDFSPKQIELNL